MFTDEVIRKAYKEGHLDGEIDALDKLLTKAHKYVQDGSKLNYTIIRKMVQEIKKESEK